ncbi:alpha/beta hydrolase [Sphingobacterium sp. SRCM116780]|uniref:alpha/beta hydrolase n=1 Tax=Sphingobacterium sp. SRCM116780 TaxID=2907623 RepID=UPI001F3882BC|nr:alpha/beta hydrolase [Sphingobacterium sp. SRCM116780]UIR55589.1 alpha/beta hydrolase [Sphingobacterium sp. SRCM116780]
MKFPLMIVLFSLIFQTSTQERLALYQDEIPNAIRKDTAKYNANIPELFVYKPNDKKGNGFGVLIIPGGGYAHIAMDHEGHDVAKKLTQAGFTAFVLKYRLPSPNIMVDKSIGPIQDAQRAMQLIRSNFPSLSKVGVIGFSAGGHLASTLITKSDHPFIANPDHLSLAPDFAGLIYPVISMTDAVTHKGSKLNLLGENASLEKVNEFSAEKNVNKDVCPVFFVHAKDDKTVPIENSYLMMRALDQVHVKNKLLTYEEGGHGFGLFNKTSSVAWLDSFIDWTNRL